jgi:hypothetical protein
MGECKMGVSKRTTEKPTKSRKSDAKGVRRKVGKLTRNLAVIGREIIEEQRVENLTAVEGFEIGEAVQYFDQGWRYGFVRELPIKGLNKGRARVEHSVTGRKTWVDGTGLRHLWTEGR